MSEFTVHCPKCDGIDIREKNIAYADLEVVAWELDADGDARPSEYDTDVDAEWETEDVTYEYVCWNPRCEHRCTLDQLVVRHADTSEDTDGR